METPTIVLVHGFWGGAAHWGKVILELSKQGYTKLQAVELPLTSLADDAERTQKMIKQIDGPVLLAGHSYGGAVITEAGDQPNVVGLVYVAAFAPDAGESPGGISEKRAPRTRPSPGTLFLTQTDICGSNKTSIRRASARILTTTTHGSWRSSEGPLASTFSDTVTSPAWKLKPTWYQVSTQDRMIHPDNQREMGGRMNARKLIEIAAGHASLASHPHEIANLIIDAVKDLEQQ